MTHHPKTPSRMVKPTTNYVITTDEFDKFCRVLENVKSPSRYCSNIAKYVSKKKFGALKSHDYDVII